MNLVLWDLMEKPVLQDQRGQLETKGPGVQLESQAFLDPRESKGRKERLDHMEILDHLEDLDFQ